MKKILLSIIAIISVISLTGCMDEKLYNHDKLEKIMKEQCADDVVTEKTYDPVNTGSKGKNLLSNNITNYCKESYCFFCNL